MVWCFINWILPILASITTSFPSNYAYYDFSYENNDSCFRLSCVNMKQKQYGVKRKRILNYFPPVYQHFRSQSTHQLSKWDPVSKELITTYSSKRSFWDSQNLCGHMLTLNCHELYHGTAASLAEHHKKSGIHEKCYFPPILWKFISLPDCPFCFCLYVFGCCSFWSAGFAQFLLQETLISPNI